MSLSVISLGSRGSSDTVGNMAVRGGFNVSIQQGPCPRKLRSCLGIIVL